MSAKVIQGSFLSGQPKLAASVQRRIGAPPSIQAKTAARPSGPPVPPFAGRPGSPPSAFAARPPGPPAPAFAPRPAAVQRHGKGDAFAVEPGQLGLASVGGRPLPEAVRGKMEEALGADFSAVRVHVGPQAERIGAIAFTIGSDIYFAPGRYQPDTVQGQQLLGHELTHVVQQRAGRVCNPLGAGLAVVHDHALEAEADRLGHRISVMRAPVQRKGATVATPPPKVHISALVPTGTSSFRLAANVEGRSVGSVMVHAGPKAAVEVTDLGVASSYREQGIGKMLLASAARTGRLLGKSRVSLAAQDNGSGRLNRWYREMGFTQAGLNSRGHIEFEAPISRLDRSIQRRVLQAANRTCFYCLNPACNKGSICGGGQSFANLFGPVDLTQAGYHRDTQQMWSQQYVRESEHMLPLRTVNVLYPGSNPMDEPAHSIPYAMHRQGQGGAGGGISSTGSSATARDWNTHLQNLHAVNPLDMFRAVAVDTYHSAKLTGAPLGQIIANVKQVLLAHQQIGRLTLADVNTIVNELTQMYFAGV
jgi:ribosomal protein S18 acetylase RimI-like enzyme